MHRTSNDLTLSRSFAITKGGRFWIRVIFRFSLAASVILTATSLLLVGVYYQEQRHELDLLRQQSERVLEMKVALLSREFRWVKSDLLYLAGQSSLRRLAVDSNGTLAQVQQEYVRLAEQKHDYDQIRFLDAEGKEVVRVNYSKGRGSVVPEDELQTKANRYYYQQALGIAKEELFVSPLDLNVEQGKIERPLKPVVRFITPVDDRDDNRIGLVAINYLGGNLLDRIAQLPAGTRGSVLVVNSMGDYLRGPSPHDDWGWQLEHGQGFRRSFSHEWDRFQSGGSLQQRTDAGLFTFRRFSPFEMTLPRTGDRYGNSEDRVQSHSPGSSEIILVAHVPDNSLNASSRVLLEKILVVTLIALVVVLGLAWYWAYSGAMRSVQREQLTASEARLRTLSKELLASQEVERRRLSRELHDNLKQQVTALRLQLQMAMRQLADPLPQSLEHAEAAVDRLLDDLQELAMRIRTSLLDDLGLEEALEEFLHRLDGISATRYEWAIDLADHNLPTVVSENIFRIVQEATSNIEKHSDATAATIQLRVIDDTIDLQISDNGVGFDMDTEPQSQLGILGMRERVELLDGKWMLSSSPGEGCAVHVQVPLCRKQPQQSS